MGNLGMGESSRSLGKAWRKKLGGHLLESASFFENDDW